MFNRPSTRYATVNTACKLLFGSAYKVHSLGRGIGTHVGAAVVVVGTVVVDGGTVLVGVCVDDGVCGAVVVAMLVVLGRGAKEDVEAGVVAG